MLLDLGKSLSFLLGLLSLFPLMFSAFFIPGTHWEDRLFLSLNDAAISACLCFASGLLFSVTTKRVGNYAREPVLSTLPVRLYFWALAGMAFLFAASWFLETYYVPLLWKNLPYKF